MKKIQKKKFYSWADEIMDIIEDYLNVTIYIVEDEIQAGRMFSVLNDRGKS